jgi:group I intron endonuclease
MAVSIYTLSDPNTKIIKYIGKTKRSLNSRLNEHIYASKNKKYPAATWINSLQEKPIIELIDEVSDNDWQFWEQYWISQFKTWGFKLKNIGNGGEIDNTGRKVSEETKKKMSLSRKGKKHKPHGPMSQELKNKISNSLKGRPSPLKGRTLSEETIKKMNLGREQNRINKLKNK